MNRPGFMRNWPDDRVAHKGFYDRHGHHFLLPIEAEDWIVDKCGGCLVALYTLSLRQLTEYLQEWQTDNLNTGDMQ